MSDEWERHDYMNRGIECPRCDGTGEVPHCGAPMEMAGHLVRCPLCVGSGLAYVQGEDDGDE